MTDLRDRAIILADRAKDIQDAPFMQRPALALDLGGDLADLLVEIATRIDAMTPYADEGES